MRTLTLYMQMTLDGFIAGPQHQLDWMAGNAPEVFDDFSALMAGMDTGLMGAVTYREMAGFWPTAADDPATPTGMIDMARIMNTLPKRIFTASADELKWQGCEPEVITTDNELAAAVMRLKAGSGRGMVLFGGVRTAQTVAGLGLVDDFQLIVHPIALGDGQRLFTSRTPLAVTSVKRYSSGVLALHCPAR